MLVLSDYQLLLFRSIWTYNTIGGQGRNFGQAQRGEAPEDTSNIVANVARVSEGAEQTRFGVLSGVALFAKNEALQGRNSRQGSQL